VPSSPDSIHHVLTDSAQSPLATGLFFLGPTNLVKYTGKLVPNFSLNRVYLVRQRFDLPLLLVVTLGFSLPLALLRLAPAPVQFFVVAARFVGTIRLSHDVLLRCR